MKANGFDQSLGIVEVGSIPAGMRALDLMLKEAPVAIRAARAISPARYIAVVEGDVESTTRAVARGRAAAGRFLVAELFLAAPHPQVMEVMSKCRAVGAIDALGVFETRTVAGAIAAADQAVKTADVALIEARFAMSLHGRAYFTVTGEVSNVEAALEAAEQVAALRGDFVDRSIIANPDAAAAALWLKPPSPHGPFGAE